MKRRSVLFLKSAMGLLLGLAACCQFASSQSTAANKRSLRVRMLSGENVSSALVPTNATKEKVHEIINEKHPDILYLDAHHHACTEWDIDRIVKAAQELQTPVMMRIDHADQASMISSMLDLGLFSIKVPTVEDEATVQRIIDGFYFPPLGKRSLGGANNWGQDIAKKEGKPYYQWWNENAILGLKLETVKGVLNVRYLAKDGVTFFDFGGQDLRHDMMIQKHPMFESIEDCRAFVKKSLEGKNVKF